MQLEEVKEEEKNRMRKQSIYSEVIKQKLHKWCQWVFYFNFAVVEKKNVLKILI